MAASKHCPVCNALVSDDHVSAVYCGDEFWFCSQQCRNKLKMLPELFIGDVVKRNYYSNFIQKREGSLMAS